MGKIRLDIDDLFQRYFQGQLTDSEYEILTDLLSKKENLDLFNQFKDQWNKNPLSSEHVKKNWHRVNYKISQTKGTLNSRSNKLQNLNRIISYAAILIIGLFLGGLIKFFVFDANDELTQQFVFETPRGEKSKVTLPDGSEVWLNAKSRLAYHTFNKERKVELQGEAYFKVAHNKSKPFTVVTPECNIEVLGTTFNVLAYEEFGRNEITLVEGKVKVSNKTQNKLLKPNQVMLVRNGQMSVQKIEPEQSFAWVDNKFNFTNIPLPELIIRLENWYDVDIHFKDNLKADINFTGVFKNEETVWQVLDALKVYIPIDYQRSNTRKIELWISN